MNRLFCVAQVRIFIAKRDCLIRHFNSPDRKMFPSKSDSGDSPYIV